MSRLLFHECLGRGGYGEVYRCTWARREMELEVAVKVLNAAVSKGSEAQKRLKDEARLLGALTHPGILRVYDLVELDGNVAMICEYVKGADLDRCVLEGLPARALLEVVSRVASALAAAWGDVSPVSGKALRLVHRDVKPENIRITPHGDVKLLDFGVARAAELRREAKTATNTVMGSYRYMAPERFDVGPEPHPTFDVFALGCILYEGLAYRRLFEHLTMREMMLLSIPGSTRYTEYLTARLAELPPETPPAIADLIRKLTSVEPEDRLMPDVLAAICDDEAERLKGLSLTAWCSKQSWEVGKKTGGSWSRQVFHLDDESAEVGAPIIGHVYPPDAAAAAAAAGDNATNEETLSGPGKQNPPAEPPSFAPRGLEAMSPFAADEDEETDIHEDHVRLLLDDEEPTVDTFRPPPPPKPPIRSSELRAVDGPVRTEGLPTPAPKPPRNPVDDGVDPDQTLKQPRDLLEKPDEDVKREMEKRAKLARTRTLTLDIERGDLAGTEDDEPEADPLQPPDNLVWQNRMAREPSEESPKEGAGTPTRPPPREPPPIRRMPRDDDSMPMSLEPLSAMLREHTPEKTPDPDRTATEAVNLDKLRASVEAEKQRMAKLREDFELDPATAEVETERDLTRNRQDNIPDDLFDVPIRTTARDAPQESEEIEVGEVRPRRRKAGGGMNGAVLANLAVLGILIGLGVLGLLGWVLFF